MKLTSQGFTWVQKEAKLILTRINIFLESLILAQDERWRRA